jgi:hypothetical protein
LLIFLKNLGHIPEHFDTVKAGIRRDFERGEKMETAGVWTQNGDKYTW